MLNGMKNWMECITFGTAQFSKAGKVCDTPVSAVAKEILRTLMGELWGWPGAAKAAAGRNGENEATGLVFAQDTGHLWKYST